MSKNININKDYFEKRLFKATDSLSNLYDIRQKIDFYDITKGFIKNISFKDKINGDKRIYHSISFKKSDNPDLCEDFNIKIYFYINTVENIWRPIIDWVLKWEKIDVYKLYSEHLETTKTKLKKDKNITYVLDILNKYVYLLSKKDEKWFNDFISSLWEKTKLFLPFNNSDMCWFRATIKKFKKYQEWKKTAKQIWIWNYYVIVINDKVVWNYKDNKDKLSKELYNLLLKSLQEVYVCLWNWFYTSIVDYIEQIYNKEERGKDSIHKDFNEIYKLTKEILEANNKYYDFNKNKKTLTLKSIRNFILSFERDTVDLVIWFNKAIFDTIKFDIWKNNKIIFNFTKSKVNNPYKLNMEVDYFIQVNWKKYKVWISWFSYDYLDKVLRIKKMVIKDENKKVFNVSKKDINIPISENIIRIFKTIPVFEKDFKPVIRLLIVYLLLYALNNVLYLYWETISNEVVKIQQDIVNGENIDSILLQI